MTFFILTGLIVLLIGALVANLVELNASVDALSAQVAVTATEIAALKAAQGAATEADLDVVKGKVDAAVAVLAAA